MALPAQVQRDNEEIAAYEAALKAEQTGATAPVVQTAEVITPEAIPVAPVAVVSEPVEAAPSNVVELKPAADEDSWKQRYLTLQGMQKAEAKSHKELKQQFEQLQAEVAIMRTPPAQAKSLVTDEETVEYGADLLDVQRRIAKEELAPLTAQMERLQAENKVLRGQVGQTEAQVASSSFEQKLARAIPDFDAVNANPKWVVWLDEFDPMLRSSRREVAQAAYERGDIDATAAYVALFKSTIKPASVTPNTAAAELQSQVAPSKSSSSASAPADSQMLVYTEAEAGQLFDKVGQLYRKGKNEEASKLDAEITLAYHEGRVR